MPKTAHLNLELTTDSSTLFEAWRKSINYEGDETHKSNMQIIDDAFGLVKRTVLQITISVVDWTDNACTKTCMGATATNFIQVSPEPSDFLAYVTAQIRATAQGTNSLTFVCTTTPTEEITVNVLIVG